MNNPKPAAVLHERAGNLDLFKLHNGRSFLIVGPYGTCLPLAEWEAQELYKWLGANLPPVVSESSYAYANLGNQAKAAIPPLPSTAYAEEAPLKR